jgi:hypothetical protein
MATRTFGQPPTQSQTKYLKTDNLGGGAAYYPAAVNTVLETTTIPYERIGNIINCSTFADLQTLYTDINNADPSGFVMGPRWIMQDLNQTLDFQVNGELIQRLRLVKRNTFAHTGQPFITDDFKIFYVPTYIAFDATSASSIFDSIYVSRTG